MVWMEGHGTALDRHEPQRLAIWTYRPLEGGPGSEGPLTPMEKRIARYLVNGFTSKEIALTLGSSPRTVEVHRANMIRKLQVRNSAELISRLLAATGDSATHVEQGPDGSALAKPSTS